MNEVKEYVEREGGRFVEELMELIKIPSISADSQYAGEVRRAAESLMQSMTSAGVELVKLYETPGHPIVYGESMVDASWPTVLVYGHYDVQPPDPIDLWDSPPFEPVIRKTELHPEGAIFARGACDDKGQLFMHVKAIEIIKALKIQECNIKFLFEGEEEVGSEHLETFCSEHKELLANDVILISDTGIIDMQTPSIDYGLRGLSYVEVEVTGPNRDLHSGVYGGAVANPVNVLCKMISSLHDAHGRITIEGFYDDVVELSEDERAKLNDRPFDLEVYKKDLDVREVGGEEGYNTLERASIRPTLDVNGMWGGYIGEGAKTVLPSKAYAKISMRLVPDQDPHIITDKFVEHFLRIAPPAVQVKVTPHHGGHPAVTPIDSIEYRAAAEAMKTSFGKEPVPTRGGGSIPIVAMFEKILGSKSVLMGFGLDSDAIHSPNEHFGLANYFKGIETIPLFFQNYARLKKGQS